MRHHFISLLWIINIFNIAFPLQAAIFRINAPKIDTIPSYDRLVISDRCSPIPLCSTERYVLLFRLQGKDDEYFAIANNREFLQFLSSKMRYHPVFAIKNPDRYAQLSDAPIFQIISSNQSVD